MIVLELCGPNIESLLKYYGGKFTIPTVLMIADQMIKRLEEIHNRGIIHRDIKPENIVIGPIEKPNTLFFIDFGLGKRYIKNGHHIPPKKSVGIVGTLRFCSKRKHEAKE